MPCLVEAIKVVGYARKKPRATELVHCRTIPYICMHFSTIDYGGYNSMYASYHLSSMTSHIRKTPNRVCTSSSTRPPNAAAKLSPNTRLVCAGGITPSSQSRAEEKIASDSRSMRAFSSGSAVRPTASITAESCSEPMTPILALGHMKRSRGE